MPSPTEPNSYADSINHKISACVSELRGLLGQLPGKGITKIELDGGTYDIFGQYIHKECGKSKAGVGYTPSVELIWNGIKLTRNDVNMKTMLAHATITSRDYDRNHNFYCGYPIVEASLHGTRPDFWNIVYAVPEVYDSREKTAQNYAHNDPYYDGDYTTPRGYRPPTVSYTHHDPGAIPSRRSARVPEQGIEPFEAAAPTREILIIDAHIDEMADYIQNGGLMPDAIMREVWNRVEGGIARGRR